MHIRLVPYNIVLYVPRQVFFIEIINNIMVPTGTGKQGKPGKMGRHFPVREFCQDWKSQGILLKILEKSEKIILEN